MRKIIIDFSKKKDNELQSFTEHVIASMTGNEYFPTPDPSLDVISTEARHYADALAAMDGGAVKTELKKQARTALEKQLRLLATWVDIHSDGDIAKKISSGFDLAREQTRIGPLGKTTLTATPKEGMIILSCNVIMGATSYSWQITEAPVTNDSAWKTTLSSKSTLQINNLVSGRQYAFRVAPIGTDPSVNYSDIVLKFIL